MTTPIRPVAAPVRAAALLAAALLAQTAAARADTVVARWIQVGPGSSPTALAAGRYADARASTTPTILARAIITGGACPALTLDSGAPIAMTRRVAAGQLTHTPGTLGYNNADTGGYPQFFVDPAATTPASFPDGTPKATTDWAECEAVVPPGHASATIGDATLKLPVAAPRRILVIGDSGCRMARANQQNCHDAEAFPFAAVAAQAARTAPDLIVHVGDYFYRDTSCVVPAKGDVPAHEFVAGCNDPASPRYETWGDTFDSWNSDVFVPARPLLVAAPWVMVRGNHESCGRGARGWFALLDPHPFEIDQVTCAGGAGAVPAGDSAVYSGDFTPSYVVWAGGVDLLVHDSSYARDDRVDANMARNIDHDLAALLKALPAERPAVYVTHKPTYGLVAGAPTDSGNFTEQATFSGHAVPDSAFAAGVPDRIALFLSGHIHQFEYIAFDDTGRIAPQLIVGMAGDNLDKTTNPDGTTLTYSYRARPFTVHTSPDQTASTTVRAAFSLAQFGFAVLDATPDGFVATVYDIAAREAGRCTITLRPRNVACWD